MIVRGIQSGWRIVFQSQHGLIAGRFAWQLKHDGRLPFWDATCVAATLHDDHKKAFESGQRRYLTDAGAPLDYAIVPMDADKRFEDTRQRINEAMKKHRWIGLLVSKHVEFLYGDEEGVDDRMRELLVDEADRRERVLSQMDATTEELSASYAWMKWCDRCSLILCGEDVPAMNRRVEVMAQPDGILSYLHLNDDQTMRIEPWPFVDDRLEVVMESRVLTRLQFEDDADLWDALFDAEVVEERSVLCR